MCNYNYAPVEPSEDANVCTHRYQFSSERAIVKSCAAITTSRTCTGNCIWNECGSDYGEFKGRSPCPTKDAPYCIQSNGQFNPGYCSKDETAQIKCVPAVETGPKQDRETLLGCLELNSEERCSDEDRCKWLGEKTICHNVAGWTATKGGMGCSIFAQKYCRDGDIKEEFL